MDFFGGIFLRNFLKFRGNFWRILWEFFWEFFREFFRNCLGIYSSRVLIWEFLGNSLGILWEFFGIYLGILWNLFGNSLEFLWEFFGNFKLQMLTQTCQYDMNLGNFRDKDKKHFVIFS